jgi:hypothetical protein
VDGGLSREKHRRWGDPGGFESALSDPASQAYPYLAAAIGPDMIFNIQKKERKDE